MAARPGHPFTRQASGKKDSAGKIAFAIRPTTSTNYKLIFTGSRRFETSQSKALSVTVS